MDLISNAGVEPRTPITRLIRAGANGAALAAADEVLPRLTDPEEIVGVLLSKFAALLNLNRIRDCPAVQDAAWRLLQTGADARPDHLAEFHALAAHIAHRRGSLEGCVTALVRGSRALESMPADVRAVRSWMSMAITYSYIGFHQHAVAAQRHALGLSRNGTPEDRRYAAHPEIRVRYAVHLDQQGETNAAKDILASVTARLTPADITDMEIPYLGYAIARLRALGGACGTDPLPLLRTDLDPHAENAELRRLGEAALCIAEDQPKEALVRLREAHATHSRLGRAEVPRLRALAHRALGDYEAAYADQQKITFLLTRGNSRMYTLFVDGVMTRLDYDELHRSASRYADEAHTDPLTGLPNRRHLERHVADLLLGGGHGVLAVGDLDRFKAVNDVHGHLVGDQVLEHTAAILARSLRGGDFLARYGGDEFVVVFPGADEAGAREVCDRLEAAVRGHDWSDLAPGTPVSLTLGVAFLERDGDLASAFLTADQRMLAAKQAAAGR